MKKFTAVFLMIALCSLLCACQREEVSVGEGHTAGNVVEGTLGENEGTSGEKESAKTNETVNAGASAENSTGDSESADAEGSVTIEGSSSEAALAGANSAAPQDQQSFEQNVLYRADFEVPDVFGTGYTNLIDYYNDYPNGKGGGTAGNLGIAIYYKGFESVISAEDALAFKTYRGIGLGSSVEDVYAAYGEGWVDPPHEGLAGLNDDAHTVEYFIFYPGKVASGAVVDIRFYIDQNDTVMGIDIVAIYKEFVTENTEQYLFEIVDD